MTTFDEIVTMHHKKERLHNAMIALNELSAPYGYEDRTDDYIYFIQDINVDLDDVIEAHFNDLDLTDIYDLEILKVLQSAKEFILVGFGDNELIVDDYPLALKRLTHKMIALLNDIEPFLPEEKD